MSIAELERPKAVDELVERAGDTARSVAGELEEVVADVRRQTAEAGSDVVAEARRVTADRDLRNSAAVVVAALLAIGIAGLIVLLRRRADTVRTKKRAR